MCDDKKELVKRKLSVEAESGKNRQVLNSMNNEHFQRQNLLKSFVLLPHKCQNDDEKVNSYLRQNNSNGQAM